MGYNIFIPDKHKNEKWVNYPNVINVNLKNCLADDFDKTSWKQIASNVGINWTNFDVLEFTLFLDEKDFNFKSILVVDANDATKRYFCFINNYKYNNQQKTVLTISATRNCFYELENLKIEGVLERSTYKSWPELQLPEPLLEVAKDLDKTTLLTKRVLHSEQIFFRQNLYFLNTLMPALWCQPGKVELQSGNNVFKTNLTNPQLDTSGEGTIETTQPTTTETTTGMSKLNPRFYSINQFSQHDGNYIWGNNYTASYNYTVLMDSDQQFNIAHFDNTNIKLDLLAPSNIIKYYPVVAWDFYKISNLNTNNSSGEIIWPLTLIDPSNYYVNENALLKPIMRVRTIRQYNTYPTINRTDNNIQLPSTKLPSVTTYAHQNFKNPSNLVSFSTKLMTNRLITSYPPTIAQIKINETLHNTGYNLINNPVTYNTDNNAVWECSDYKEALTRVTMRYQKADDPKELNTWKNKTIEKTTIDSMVKGGSTANQYVLQRICKIVISDYYNLVEYDYFANLNATYFMWSICFYDYGVMTTIRSNFWWNQALNTLIYPHKTDALMDTYLYEGYTIQAQQLMQKQQIDRINLQQTFNAINIGLNATLGVGYGATAIRQFATGAIDPFNQITQLATMGQMENAGTNLQSGYGFSNAGQFEKQTDFINQNRTNNLVNTTRTTQPTGKWFQNYPAMSSTNTAFSGIHGMISAIQNWQMNNLLIKQAKESQAQFITGTTAAKATFKASSNWDDNQVFRQMFLNDSDDLKIYAVCLSPTVAIKNYVVRFFEIYGFKQPNYIQTLEFATGYHQYNDIYNIEEIITTNNENNESETTNQAININFLNNLKAQLINGIFVSAYTDEGIETSTLDYLDEQKEINV